MGKNQKGVACSKGGTTAAFTPKQNLAIVYRATGSLSPDPKNPRLHSDKQVQQIARSIEAFGFNVPLLVNAEMKVVAGHGRLQACQLLGITEVPTINLEHLTEAQARAFKRHTLPCSRFSLLSSAQGSDRTRAERVRVSAQTRP